MRLKAKSIISVSAAATLACVSWYLLGGQGASQHGPSSLSNGKESAELEVDDQTAAGSLRRLVNGRRIFRHDTFGSEDFWGGTLRLHETIKGEKLGGLGPGLSPATALALGLKVDVTALPIKLRKAIKNELVDLDDPAITVALLQLDAVVGVKGFFDDQSDLSAVGIQCSLCHSVVDDSFAPGIGRRLDGWANRDLDVGKIIAFAPNLSPFAELLQTDEETVRAVLNTWGPGKFDAELLMDGKAMRPDGKPAATLIPPAFGLSGISTHTWTGWGGVGHWNAFVANLEMRGKGTFYDPRLNDIDKFPIATMHNFFDVRETPDLITSKLPDLHFYQLALTPPKPRGGFNPAAAARGKIIFEEKADCARCHVPPLYVEPGWPMHTPEAIGIDSFQAERSPEDRYRTAPLRGLWTHTKGGFYHDGRFSTLLEVVEHYNSFFGLNLTEQEKLDLIEFLKSL